MMYVEFIKKDDFVPRETFVALGGQSAWRDPNDQLLGQISRVFGIGPLPDHIAFCRFNSFKRLDEWEDHFRSANHRADKRMHAKHKAIKHWRAACYDELMPANKPLDSKRYLVEFLQAPDTMALKTQTGASLEFVLKRIGRLAPDPGGLIVWSLPDASDDRLLFESYGSHVSAAGLYGNFNPE
jgi:hypothetical protein